MIAAKWRRRLQQQQQLRGLADAAVIAGIMGLVYNSMSWADTIDVAVI